MLALALAVGGWVVFVTLPLFALGGIGIPALQSLTTQQVDADRQGQLQGVMASIVSLASIFGPLFFATAYGFTPGNWPGSIWLVAIAIYVVALPFLFRIRNRAVATPSN